MANAKPDYNEFYDPRLVAIYNTICPLDGYEQLYFKLAKELGAKKILDIGSGTGLLTIELAKQGYEMIGVEPSKLMLEVARKNSEDLNIQWINGDATSLKEFNADLAIMTGHVAQFHLKIEEWNNALKSIYKSLKPGGYLVFESRNPVVQPWNNPNQENNKGWYAPNFHRVLNDPIEGQIDLRSELIEVDGELVNSVTYYLFTKTGRELTTSNTLIFRTRSEIEQSLKDAGFTIETVYGDWDGSIANDKSPEFIFVAKKSI
jgi:SAM-dependent methyltransferase